MVCISCILGNAFFPLIAGALSLMWAFASSFFTKAAKVVTSKPLKTSLPVPSVDTAVVAAPVSMTLDAAAAATESCSTAS